MSQDTLHLRAKMAERGHRSSTFDKDGFEKWAETEAPARVGQVQKIPAEVTKMEGDALRRLYARHAKHHEMEGGRRMRRHAEEEWEGDALRHLMHSRHAEEEWEGDALRRHHLEGGFSLKGALSSLKSGISSVKQFASSAMDVYNAVKDNPVFKSLSATAQAQVEDLAKKKGIDLSKVGKVAELVQKYGPEAEKYVDALSGGRRGRGTKKGMVRKTARLAYMPHEDEWEGGRMHHPTYHFPMEGGRYSAHGGKFDFAKALATAQKAYTVGKAGYDAYKSMKGGRRRHAEWEEEWEGDALRHPRHHEEYEGGKFDFAKALATAQKAYTVGKAGYDAYKAVKGGRRHGGKAPSARNMLVKQVMAEHGLSLPQASKYVKEHGLY